jgi:FMN-dependent NADH-azoreductase
LASLLHIHASPKKHRSVSLRLASAFIEEAQRLDPSLVVSRLNVWEEDLPEFGEDAALAKFAPIFGETRTVAQETAWARVLEEIKRFDAADRILISTPMWNFSIPYRLKHYFDLIMQPRVTFGYDREKMLHYGMLRNRPVQLILTRSSVLPGDFVDFQLPYLKFALEYIGLRDISVLAAWRTTRPTAEEREQYVASFEPQARAAAQAFMARRA